MSQVYFDAIDVPRPDLNLGVNGGTHGLNTSRMIEKIEELLLAEKPDWVLVYGDTDSALAGALAAVKLQIPIARVEAGLRTFNRRAPEEINRVLADHAADLLFAPTETAVTNLSNEGIRGTSVIQAGDVLYDATLLYRGRARRPELPCLPDEPFILCALHRAENIDDTENLAAVMDALHAISQERPVILPLHPRTRRRLTEYDRRLSVNYHQIAPVGYLEMAWLLERCHLVLTDSAELQKEAYFFQKPCVSLRQETEWAEIVETGASRLVGTCTQTIMEAYGQMKNAIVSPGSLYGDGHSATTIAEALLS